MQAGRWRLATSAPLTTCGMSTGILLVEAPRTVTGPLCLLLERLRSCKSPMAQMFLPPSGDLDQDLIVDSPDV